MKFFGRELGAPEVDDHSMLLVRAGRGDEAAFGELYDHLVRLVHGTIQRVVRDPAMSEETTQEVFVELWRTASRFDPARGSVRTWAATLAHRRAVDRVRSEQARRDREQHEFQSDHRTDEADGLFGAIHDEVPDELQLSRVRKALDQLTDKQREAIELAYYGGRTYREVAALLDTPEGTVKTRIRDGMIRLRDQLGVPA